MNSPISNNSSPLSSMLLGQQRLQSSVVPQQTAHRTVNLTRSANMSPQAPTLASSVPAASNSGLWSSAKAILQNISDIGNSARLQRQEDERQGKGLLAGARQFSSDVTGFYDYLGKVDFSKLSGGTLVDQVGGLAKDYMQKQAGQQIISAAQGLFPETTKQILSIFGQDAAAAGASVAGAANSGIVAGDGALSGIGGQVAGWAGAAYSIYELVRGKLDPQGGALAGAAAGAYIGSSILPGVGTVVGGLVGGVAGFFSGMFKSGKPKEQKERDQVRKMLQQAGILDGDWQIDLYGGGKFDMGKDGNAKLTNVDGTERKYKEFDLSNPLTAQIAQVAAPLAQSLCGDNTRMAEEFTAYFTNAATSNTTSLEGALRNLQVIYAKFGIPIEQVLSGLAQQQPQQQQVRQAA